MLTVEGYLVRAQSFQNDLSASGTLLPNEEIEIHPEISGRVTAIQFKEGTSVKKGQTLVQLYDADIIAQIQKLKAQKTLQENMLKRQADLLKIGGISQQDYETTQTGIASINADIAIQEAALRKTKIVAPFDGKIGIRNISVGAIVSPTTIVASLQQLHQLKMDFTVPDQYKDVLKINKNISLKVDNMNGTTSGKIMAVEPSADINTRSIKVRAIVPNTNGTLTAGAFAHVSIPEESAPDALLIPSQCIIPTTRDKKVALVNNGKAQLVTVTLGARTADKVQVIDGLKAGDTVITTGLMQVKTGIDVKFSKVSQ